MKWALCQSNLHPSMSQNLADGAMNSASYVMHEFVLKAMGFMHVMHVIHFSRLIMHVMHTMYALALPCMPGSVQHMYAC